MIDDSQHPSNLPPGSSRETLETAGYGDEAMHKVHTQLLREKDEPTEGFSPMPIFMLFLFGGLIFWAGVYIAKYSGDFRPDVFNPHADLAAAAQTETVFDPLARGARIFRAQCSQCHQASGEGIPGVYPPLAGSSWVNGGDGSVPVKVIMHGLQGPIVVKGNDYNSSMPPLGQLSDRDLAAVVTFIRQEWGNTGAAVEESLVTQIRSEYGTRGQWTGPELKELHPELP